MVNTEIRISVLWIYSKFSGALNPTVGMIINTEAKIVLLMLKFPVFWFNKLAEQLHTIGLTNGKPMFVCSSFMKQMINDSYV